MVCALRPLQLFEPSSLPCAAAGLGERAMELMAARARSRVAFGKPVAEQGAFVKELAGHRIQLDAARCRPSYLIVLSSAP